MKQTKCSHPVFLDLQNNTKNFLKVRKATQEHTIQCMQAIFSSKCSVDVGKSEFHATA